MLRPMNQLNAKPINTAAQPTQMMNCRVRACEAVSTEDAVEALCCDRAKILSACGSNCCPLDSISFRRFCVFRARRFHRAK